MIAAVKQKNTRPEHAVRSTLFKLGYRFRLHQKDLPGRPDIVLPRHKLVIFVHGCFWHQHSGCRKARRPTSNTAYWHGKLNENVERDMRKSHQLLELGWRVGVVWQCQAEAPELEKIVQELFADG